jgi:hypothetical protein
MLLAAVAVLRERVVGPASVLGAAERAALESSLRAAMTSMDFVMAAERGRLLTLAQALALAQTMLEQPACVTGPAGD